MDQAVQPLLDAINAGDRAAFFAALTPSATMTDDGTTRMRTRWRFTVTDGKVSHFDTGQA